MTMVISNGYSSNIKDKIMRNKLLKLNTNNISIFRKEKQTSFFVFENTGLQHIIYDKYTKYWKGKVFGKVWGWPPKNCFTDIQMSLHVNTLNGKVSFVGFVDNMMT